MANDNFDLANGQPGILETSLSNLLGYARNIPSTPELIKSSARIGAGLGARGLEAIAGVPSNIANLAADIAEVSGGGIRSLLGGVPVIGESLQKISDWLGEPADLSQRSPFTPEYLREKVTKGLTGEMLEPTSAVEEFAQNMAADIASIISMGGGLKTAAKGSLVKGLAEKATKALGFSEGAQTAAGIGGLIVGSMDSPVQSIKNMAKNAYNVLSEKTPDIKINAKPLLNKTLKTIKEQTSAGVEKTPSKNFLRRTTNSFLKKVDKEGKIGLKDLLQAEKDLNEIGFTRELKGARNLIRGLKRDVTGSLLDYGKGNKDFLNAYNDAKGLFKASIAKSFIQDKIFSPKFKGLLRNPLTWIMTGQGGKGLALYGAGKVEEAVRRLFASPKVMGIYKDLLKNAAIESKGAVIKNIKALDNQIAKTMPEFKLPQGFEKIDQVEVSTPKSKKTTKGKGFQLPSGFEIV